MDGRVNCPYCDFLNIPGDDLCDRCGQSLSDLHLKLPRSSVERGLLVDRVSALLPKYPITVRLGTTVAEVLQLMVSRRIGCVFVVEDGQAVGVFTEKDAIVRLGERFFELRERPISEFMTPQPTGVANRVRIAYVIRQMDLGGYRHIPTLTPEGDIEGVVSVRDILRYLTEKISQSAGE